MSSEMLLDSTGWIETPEIHIHTPADTQRQIGTERRLVPRTELSLPKVGLLIESSRASGRSLINGVARYTHDHGRWSFTWEPGGLECAWPKLKSLALDGIILRDVDRLEEVLSFGIPAVVVGHRRTEVSGHVNVVTDSEMIGRMAAEHLLGCGFKYFAFCGFRADASERAPWSDLRRRAFSRRLSEAGLACHSFSNESVRNLSWQEERRVLVQWIRSLPKPVGLLACNDDRARQLAEACKQAQVSVPDEVGLIGVDNDEVVCGLSDPPLSSIAVNFERAGYEAAKALDGLMRGQADVTQRIIVQATHVVVRRSTDFVAAEDLHLAKALRFIRDSLHQGHISVTDVAKASGLSRRALEKRFQQVVGHSILNEIRRVRTDHIARMLVETNLPVGEIAEQLRFSDVQHFARYFRSAKRMSPKAYRLAYGSRKAGAT